MDIISTGISHGSNAAKIPGASLTLASTTTNTNPIDVINKLKMRLDALILYLVQQGFNVPGQLIEDIDDDQVL